MKTIRNMVMIAVAAAGLAASSVNVMAQPAPGSSPGMMGSQGGPGMMGGQGGPGMGGQHATPEQREARMREHFQRFSAQLHDKLKLNASQEQAWNTYLQAMTPPAHPQRPDRAQWESMTAPQRMEQHLAMMKQHEALLSKRLDATRTFYGTLTPEQQKVFNAETAHPFKGMQEGRMHGRGQGGRMGGQQGAPGAAPAPQQR